MDAPLASVIIVNWNGREYLPACLDSLKGQTCKDFETIVVDNGSRDGSLELLRESYPWVRIVALEANTGFAGGNNAGFAVSRGRHIVTLNNDTRVEPGWLKNWSLRSNRGRRWGWLPAASAAGMSPT